MTLKLIPSVYFDEDASNLVDIDDFKRIFDSVPIKVRNLDFLA